MCTLLSISRDLFLADKAAFRKRMIQDAVMNNDGWNLVGIDPLAPLSDFSISLMTLGPVINMVDSFFSASSEYGRIFLHSRAATTDNVGVAHNHGFTDHKGVIIQHNGIIFNYRHLDVDSFNLIDYRTSSAYSLMEDLETAQEMFANVFLIRPNLRTYGVVRMAAGSLYTDGEGNYSTNLVADIGERVNYHYAMEHRMIPAAMPTTSSIPSDTWSKYTDQADEDFMWDQVTGKIKTGG